MPEFIRVDWPAPANVHAVTTLRGGGFSQPPYATFNLAAHVGDDPTAVAANRARLGRLLRLPAEPRWLDQRHTATVIDAERSTHPAHGADASFAGRPGVVCAVLTADCLPLLLCNRDGSRVAAAHAGWRGLAAGVLEATVTALDEPGDRLLAWLGPAIGPQAFEVGDEVREAFVAHDPAAQQAFRPTSGNRWLADLYLLAGQRLAACGVTAIYGGGWCTYSEPERFYSYRRDRTTGRMASLIWRDPSVIS
jgi:YfiH family protein